MCWQSYPDLPSQRLTWTLTKASLNLNLSQGTHLTWPLYTFQAVSHDLSTRQWRLQRLNRGLLAVMYNFIDFWVFTPKASSNLLAIMLEVCRDLRFSHFKSKDQQNHPSVKSAWKTRDFTVKVREKPVILREFRIAFFSNVFVADWFAEFGTWNMDAVQESIRTPQLKNRKARLMGDCLRYMHSCNDNLVTANH